METEYKYFIKLIDTSKLETNKENYNQWLYNTGDDYIICFGDGGTIIYVKKDKILLGYIKGE